MPTQKNNSNRRIPVFRMGNDLTIQWAVQDANGKPYDLSGRALALYYTTGRGQSEAKNWRITGDDRNVIEWSFKGDEQRLAGTYTLTVQSISGGDPFSETFRSAFRLTNKDYEVTDEALAKLISTASAGNANAKNDINRLVGLTFPLGKSGAMYTHNLNKRPSVTVMAYMPDEATGEKTLVLITADVIYGSSGNTKYVVVKYNYPNPLEGYVYIV